MTAGKCKVEGKCFKHIFCQFLLLLARCVFLFLFPSCCSCLSFLSALCRRLRPCSCVCVSVYVCVCVIIAMISSTACTQRTTDSTDTADRWSCASKKTEYASSSRFHFHFPPPPPFCRHILAGVCVCVRVCVHASEIMALCLICIANRGNFAKCLPI